MSDERRSGGMRDGSGCGRLGCLCGVGCVVSSVGFAAVWDFVCWRRRNNGGDVRMITVTAQLVLSLGIVWLSGGGV